MMSAFLNHCKPDKMNPTKRGRAMEKVSSMTGFIARTVEESWGGFTLEIRSVNHRFFEPTLRLPEVVRYLEPKLRETMQNLLKRGKIDLTVRYEPAAESGIQLNPQVAKPLLDICQQLAQDAKMPTTLNIGDLLDWPGLLNVATVDNELIKKTLLDLVQQGLAALQQERLREGRALAQLIKTRVHSLKETVQALRPKTSQLVQGQREKLLQKLAALNVDHDTHRLEQELVLWAQKVDVQEELDRLETHLVEVDNILQAGGSVGRRLDFLVQELHREVNTLGSKAIAVDVISQVVDMKVLIEQIREQVQNIE
jgi:uncharacterized protein (TIGR00255 family)